MVISSDPSRRLLRNWRIAAALLTLGMAASSLAQTPPPAAPAEAAAPAPDPIEGFWTGTVIGPQGEAAEIGFEFFRGRKGVLTFRLNFPSMFTYAARLGIPVEINGHGAYAITPAFDIVFQFDGEKIAGTFGKGQMPMALARSGPFAPAPPPTEHPAAPDVLWKFALGAGTWAPPVAADDTIYIGTSEGKFHAVHATDGTAAWTWSGPNAIDGRAVVSADTVYFVDTKTNLVALKRTDGSLRWLTPLHDEQLAGQPAPDNPTFNHRAATPLLLDGIVYCGSSDGGVYALDAATGAKLWRHDAKAPVFSGIGLHGADTLTFGTMDGSVVLLDRNSRNEIFRAKTGGGVVTTPLVVGNKVIVGSRDYLLYGLNLADGSVAWRFTYWFSWIESTPVLRDGLIYVGASDYSRVTAIEPATGKAQWGTPVHGMNWGSPLVTADRVFTGTAWQESAIIKHVGGIVALDRATGRVLWQLVVPPPEGGAFGGYAGSLALAGDKVIAAGFDGLLVALPAK